LGSVTPRIEIWLDGKCLDVIENVQTIPGEDSYDADVASLVEKWACLNIYPRFLGGQGLSYAQAVAAYTDGCKEHPELSERGEPLEQYSELINGTWFLSTGENLLAHVTADGEVWAWGESVNKEE
jgi:hypothetical protein